MLKLVSEAQLGIGFNQLERAESALDRDCRKKAKTL